MGKEVTIAADPAGTAQHRPAATILGLRKSALVETLLFLGAAMVMDRLFFAGDSYSQIALHPFWVLVLLMSVQYGTGEGLTAATLSTVCLLAGNLPEQGLSQDRYEYLLSVCRLPLLWFVTALILGEIRMRHIRERDTLHDDLAAVRKQQAELSRACRDLAVAKETLESRVAAQMNTALTIYEAAREMEKLEPAEVLRGMSDVVRALMKPEKFSIYILREDHLELAIEEGWTPAERSARAFTSHTGVFREIVGAQRCLCAADPVDQAILAGEALLAGPLMSGGKVFGMLKIEQLGFLRMNFSSVQTFQALCRWLGTAYGNASLHEAVRSDSVMSQDTPLFSRGFFERHTSHLAVLAARIGFDLSMFVLRLENEDELTVDQRSLIPAALAQTVKTVLRKTDLAFEYRSGHYEYAVVLPATPVANAEIVAQKLLHAMEGRLHAEAGHARLSTAVHCLVGESRGGGIHHGEWKPRHSELLLRLARRVGFDLSMVEIRLSDFEETSQEAFDRIHETVFLLLDGLLPADGSLIACRPGTCVYSVFLFPMSAETAEIEAEAVKSTITGRLKSMGIRVEVTFSVHAMHRREVADLQPVHAP